MNELTPAGAPHPDDPAGSGIPPDANKKDTPGEQPRQRNAGQILTEQQCLAGLSVLPSNLLLGYIKPPTSNAIRAVYHELLQHQQRSGRDAAQPVQVNEDVIAMLRANPAMLKQFEPLLTEEQLKMILSEPKDGDQKT